MPRNRIIKPDFWSDEKIGSLSPIARLLFIGLWNFCDDSGVCRANPVFINANILPYDAMNPKDTLKLLHELAEKGRIVLSEYGGESFLLVKNFEKHQRIAKPSEFRFILEGKLPVDHKYAEIFGASPEYNTSKVVVVSEYNENENENENENDLKDAASGASCADIDSVISHFNSVAGKSFRMNATNRNYIRSRLKDGFTIADCISAVDNQVREWKDNPDMRKYLCIETIFRKSKFEKYLNNNSPARINFKDIWDHIDLIKADEKKTGEKEEQNGHALLTN